MQAPNSKVAARVGMALLLTLAGLALPALAATISVDTTEDELNTDGDCSLREAIRAANADAAVDGCAAGDGADEIVFDPSVVPGTFRLTLGPAGDDTAMRGDLDITDDLALTGAGPAATIIDGNNRDQVFHVQAGATATITGIAVQNGKGDAEGGGGIRNAGTLFLADSMVSGNAAVLGAGIRNSGVLTLDSVTISANTAREHGGGIYNSGRGTATLSHCVLNGNTAGISGGGILNAGTLTATSSTVSANTANVAGGGLMNRRHYVGEVGVLTLIDSTVGANTAADSGGAIDTYGPGSTVTLTNSTINGNAARRGGGIHSYGGSVHIDRATVTVTNSTISGNTATDNGGGISASTTRLTLSNVTITDNTAGAGRGGYGGGISVGGPGENSLRNTIVAGNTTVGGEAPDCGGTLISQGYNLVGRTRGCAITGELTTNITGVDAKLAPLADNGGSTQTHALLAGSPAIDRGSATLPGSSADACEATDQRGVARPVDGDLDAVPRCDIGALEQIPQGALPISAVVPNRGGNTGSVLAVVYGSAFAAGATVELVRAGQPAIAGDPVTVGSGGTVAATTFDLTGKATGLWDVVVRNPDGTVATLPAGFTIEEEQAPQVWMDIIGRSVIRVRRPASFKLLFGNRGNVDALGVLLWLYIIPKDLAVTLRFPIAPPPPQEGQVSVDWSRMPTTMVSDKLSDATVIPLVVPVVPAGFTGALEFTLTAPGGTVGRQFQFASKVDPPYFRSTVDSQIVESHVRSARSYLQEFAGTEVPQTLVPELRHYVTAQLQSLVGSGDDAWVHSLGTKGSVYSLAQLLFDLTLFADATLNPASGETGGVAGDDGDEDGDGVPDAYDKCKGTPKGMTVFIPSPQSPAGPLAGCPIEQGCTRGWSCSPDNAFPKGSVGAAQDPNEKVGSPGATEARYVSGEEPLRYAVYFENVETATLPAQEVMVTDQLDAAKVDLGTLSFGPMAFGGQQVIPNPGLQNFETDVDLRPAINLIVRTAASLDPDTGRLTWRFTSIDPATGEVPEDPLLGFLPPNVNPPEGEGSVLFTVKPKPGFGTGTEIRNRAAIVFDVNPPIDTAEWANTLDNDKPTSQVLSLAAAQSSPSFAVRWSGTDQGAGILDYSIFVSEGGGGFEPWLVNSTATSEMFTGRSGKTYAFYSVARDRAGNVEESPTAPDAITAILPCVGDCNRDARVAVDELIKGVNLALGNLPVSACAVFDRDASGTVSIDELVAAVRNALQGCP